MNKERGRRYTCEAFSLVGPQRAQGEGTLRTGGRLLSERNGETQGPVRLQICGWLKARSNDAAAAKSLQSCPTLCNPIDSSPPGSPVPGILQARILENNASNYYILSMQ